MLEVGLGFMGVGMAAERALQNVQEVPLGSRLWGRATERAPQDE